MNGNEWKRLERTLSMKLHSLKVPLLYCVDSPISGSESSSPEIITAPPEEFVTYDEAQKAREREKLRCAW